MSVSTAEQFAADCRPTRWQWKAWLFKVLTFPPIALVYMPMAGEGIKRLNPDFGRPLWRAVPGLQFLRHYEGFHKLELAHPMALIILVASAFLCAAAMKSIINSDFSLRGKILYTLAGSLLLADATFFYASLQHGGIWGSTSWISFSALLMMMAYILILLTWAAAAASLED